MRDRPGIVGLERARDAEARGDDVDEAIRRAEEEVGRAGAQAGEVGLERDCVRKCAGLTGEAPTPKSAELSSGSLTGDTSMKLNAFHWMVSAPV